MPLSDTQRTKLLELLVQSCGRPGSQEQGQHLVARLWQLVWMTPEEKAAEFRRLAQEYRTAVQTDADSLQTRMAAEAQRLATAVSEADAVLGELGAT